MPQGEGGSASRDQNQRAQLVLSSSAADLTSNHSLLNTFNENTRGRSLAYEELTRCFHLPINAAAKELGVCVTALKKQCRKHGVPRWPHRKLKSLDKLKEKLEKEEATAADKEYYKHEIHSIAQKKDHIFRSSASASAPNAASDPSMSLVTGAAPSSSARPPAHQVVIGGGHVAHYRQASPGAQKATGATVAPHYAHAQGRNPTLIPFATDSDKQQMLPASLVMPFPHVPGAASPGIPGPNGTIMPQPGQPFALCGIYGCDCYMNNGVSSRMYHSPLPTARMANGVNHVPSNNATRSPGLRNNGSAVNPHPTVAGPIPNVHYFSPSAYAYGPAVAHVGPYQNMVQVNVVERSSFPRSAQAAPSPSSGSNGVGSSSGSQSQPVMNHSGAGHSAASGYEVYGNVPRAANGTGNAFVYGPFVPPNMHYNGVVEHQAGAAGVSGFWTEMQQHQQNRPGNLVTMCNQTVYHHHHHGPENAATTTAVMTDRRPGNDNASSKTNNSEARDNTSADAGSNETGGKPQNSKTDQGSGNLGVANRNSSAPKKIRNVQEKLKPGKEVQNPVLPIEKNTVSNEKCASSSAERNRRTNIGLRGGAHTESESKTTSVRANLPNGTQFKLIANGRPGGSSTQNSSETTNYSARSNDENLAKDSQSRKRNKRPRVAGTSSTDSANASADRKTLKGISNNLLEGRPQKVQANESTMEIKNAKKNHDVREDGSGKPSDSKKTRTEQRQTPESSRKRDSRGFSAPSPTGNQHGAAAGPDFAKRYDHVVHQCLGLQTAQWCTDLNFKVTLALGPKALLGLAGVPSLGRSVLDGTETALEGTDTARTKYALSARGQRLEWIAQNGTSRYLVVMNPYRKRNCQEIAGVSGLMVELKIIKALTN